MTVLLLTACTSYTRPDENAGKVRLLYASQGMEPARVLHGYQCSMKGEVIGSEGHWYNYLFMTNANMMQGALNNLKNNALKKGANTVVIFQDVDFVTSVTFVGQSYNCRKSSQPAARSGGQQKPRSSKSRF